MKRKTFTFGISAMGLFLSFLLGCMAATSNTLVSNIETQQLGDNALTCEQIKGQVQQMEQVMQRGGLNTTNDALTSAATQAGSQAAVSAASQAAPSAMPFVGPLMQAVTSVSSQNRISAQQLASQAQARRQQLIYMYNNKGCK